MTRWIVAAGFVLSLTLNGGASTLPSDQERHGARKSTHDRDSAVPPLEREAARSYELGQLASQVHKPAGPLASAQVTLGPYGTFGTLSSCARQRTQVGSTLQSLHVRLQI